MFNVSAVQIFYESECKKKFEKTKLFQTAPSPYPHIGVTANGAV